uniref:CSON001739 protein n=1 Tax=Culicoides sonorensis TaxID=179676 RepID=A0A336KX76_CULSO
MISSGNPTLSKSFFILLILNFNSSTFGFFYDDSWLRASSITSVDEDEFKFVASLRDRFNTFHCPASIIDRKWALTTAECVYYLSTHSTVLITGTKSLINGGKANKIEKFIVHPDFSHYKLENDIALIQLENNLDFDEDGDDDKINSIKIDSNLDNDLLVYSWGFADHIKASNSIDLQKLSLKSLTMGKCVGSLPNFIARLFDKTNTVCASDSNQQQSHQKGTCNLHSGAPVVNKNKKSLIAIGSNSRPCVLGSASMFLKTWAQSFTDAVDKANDLKNNKVGTSSYEWFQVFFYAIHMLIGMIGIFMFIYGVGFDAFKTYKIGIVQDSNRNVVFMTPAIFCGVSMLFSICITLNYFYSYRKIVARIYFLLAIGSIVTAIVLWCYFIKLDDFNTEQEIRDDKIRQNCIEYCTYKS